MTNTNWTEKDLAAAADRVYRGLSTRIRRHKRIQRLAFTGGMVALGVVGIAAASTALPPQMKGDISTAPAYLMPVRQCLADASWNVWIEQDSNYADDSSVDSVHFSISGYENEAFANDIDLCRARVATMYGVTHLDVVGE